MARKTGGRNATKTKFNREDRKFDKHDRKRDSGRYPKDVSQEREVTSSTGTEHADDRKCNDPSWYDRDPALMFSAANHPFSEPLGSAMPTLRAGGTVFGKTVSPDIKGLSIPGLMAMTVKPSIGSNSDRNSPINVAAQAFYTHVRYVNSGRKNYDQADLMMYALSVSDMYSYIMWLERIYSCAFMYSQRNYYIGKHMLTAMGIDADDIIMNLANFRYVINVFINKISSFVVPNDISLFKRRAFMYAGFFTENKEGSIKDQIYFFKPAGFYKYGLDSTNKGCLEFLSIPTTLQKMSDLMNIGNQLLSDIFGDEDFGLISGDILKAYGSNIIGLSAMPEELYVLPVYDEYVLSQFKNATLVGSGVITTPLGEPLTEDVQNNNYAISNNSNKRLYYGNIYQDEVGNIHSREAVAGSLTARFAMALNGATESPLNVNAAMPTPADVMEATRLMVTSTGSSEEVDVLPLICGTEIVIRCQIFSFTYDADGTSSLTTYAINDPAFTTRSVGEALVKLANFRYRPTLIVFASSSDAVQQMTEIPSWYYANNFENVTYLSVESLERLHEVALLSLLYVPGVTKVQNL